MVLFISILPLTIARKRGRVYTEINQLLRRNYYMKILIQYCAS